VTNRERSNDVDTMTPMTSPVIRANGLLYCLLAVQGCSKTHPPDPVSGTRTGPYFEDVTDAMNVGFTHYHGGSGKKYFVETNGSGAAWLDYDLDADLDLYLVQGAPLPGFEGAELLTDRLLRNDGSRFVDVTERCGIDERHHGMAAAAADYDNDGDPDLLITNFGPTTLYRNRGDGTFEEVSEQAGLRCRSFYQASCAFADLDNDRDLDLYICGYVRYQLDDPTRCGEPERGDRYLAYCHPHAYAAEDDAFYRNNGDGTFSDLSVESGIHDKACGKGLGVCAGDYDGDGDLDLFVANDSDANFLWRNDGELRLVDVAPLVGVDYNGDGLAQACMGCAFGDIDHDLDLDLFTVNLSGETNTLYRNEGATFRDRSFPSGLAAFSEPFVGFGTVFADIDNDSHLDVVIANGHVLDNPELFAAGARHAQEPHLVFGRGDGKFDLVSPEVAGPYFAELNVGRALAAADFDNDGDLDLLFTNNNGRARLLRNVRGNQHSWLGLKLVGTSSNRDAIGATVRVDLPGFPILRAVRGSESYLSFHDLRVLIGLGSLKTPVDVTVCWPDGHRQDLKAMALNRYHMVVEDSTR